MHGTSLAKLNINLSSRRLWISAKPSSQQWQLQSSMYESCQHLVLVRQNYSAYILKFSLLQFILVQDVDTMQTLMTVIVFASTTNIVLLVS